MRAPAYRGYTQVLRSADGTLLAVGATGDGEFFKRVGTTIVTVAGSPGGYTDEQAQDAVGGMVDTTLTYVDGTPSLGVKLQMSVTSDTSGLKLSGDAETPGASKVYGTDGSGVKGWQSPQGGLADAPSNGTLYGRKDAAWSTVPSSLTDAPSDGAAYGRKNAAWVTVLTVVNAHTMGGVSHSADTYANLSGKVSDATLVAIGGQIGGTGTSPTVIGIQAAASALTIGAIVDGQYLKRVGATLVSAVPAGGSTPPWYGKIIGCMGDGDPNDMLEMMLNNPIHATPTNIAITVARCSYFRPPANIVVNTIRFFGVGATTAVYHVAIYATPAGGARLTADLSPDTAAQAWGTAGTGLNLTLTAGVLYLIAVSVDTIGTTAGMHCMSSTTGRIGVLPASWPGNLDIDLATPIIDPVAFVQFAVSTGVMPATLPAIVAQAAWAGGMPAIFLDNA